MESLDKRLVSKIENLVEKLQKLECTLLGNNYKIWVMELLFKPGVHRYNLIEWILKKLEYNMDEICQPSNSIEEKIAFLEAAISELGFLGENDQDIMKGTASVEEQLKFWTSMVDILWVEFKINSDFSLTDSDEGVALSQDRSQRSMLELVYEGAFSSINKICESVNIKHLFEHKIKLLPPDAEKEIECMSSQNMNMPSLPDLKTQAKEKNHCTNLKEVCETLCFSKLTVEENGNDSEEELNRLENEMSKCIIAMKNLLDGDFNDVYDELKPWIQHVKPEEFKDAGPEFNNTLPLLENMLQAKEIIPKLSESNNSFIKVKEDLDYLFNEYHLEDSKSSDLAQLLKEES